MGSIGDIALEKALPFDGANSGTASSSADADSVSILTTIDAVVYDWDIATDRLTWSSNVETTLAGFARTALATGAGFAARITCDSESSRFHVVHNGPARDEGQGVPFRVSYRMASSQDTPYEVEAPHLPKSLEQALAALREDACLAAGFGKNFIDYYLRIKEAEIARYQSEVTEWEQREYFELF